MADRTVKVKLIADVSDYTAGLVKAAAATKGLAGDIEKNVDRDMGPSMRRAGEKSGGLLARGMNQGIMRNSPLIVAGVTAALAAGAPAVLAGVTVLFGAVGGLAAAQTAEVREAWTDMGHDIRDSAVQDASVLVPVYVGMADKIGASFQRLRPEIRDAFEASAPLIDRFTDGLTDAAENAMPGLVRAIERGGPVIEGLGSLMESIGTGLSDFLDAMSDDNADAAGAALEAIGDALEAALPLLGEMLGTGSELAAIVLPPLADALQVAADAAAALGPLLPAIVTGFAAMKVAQTAAGWMAGLSGHLARLGVKEIPGVSSAAGKLSGGLSAISGAVPILGAAVALVGFAFARGEQEIAAWGQAAEGAYAKIAKGGAAAVAGRQQLDAMREAAADLEDGFGRVVGSPLDDKLNEVAAAARRSWDAMDPLQQSQAKLAEWTSTLSYRLNDESASAEDVAIAQRKVAEYTAETERQQALLEGAITGVTQAMLDQAAAALAASNSDLAYRMSVDGTESAVAALTTAVSEFGAGSEEASDAALAVESSLLRQAEAARQSAFDTSAATSEAGKNAEADAAMLAELLQLQSTMGSSFPAALNTTIARLQGSTDAGMVAAAQFNDLGLKVLSVPDSKTIIVSSTTPEQIKLLESLGYKVETLPDGTVRVTAQTAEAEAAMNFAARDRYSTVYQHLVQTGVSAEARGRWAASVITPATGGAIVGGRLQHFDIGGAVRGPGGPTADQVPAMLSNGEHVWTASEVQAAGGQAAVAAMRRMVLSGREQSGWSPGSGSAGAASQTREVRITAVAAPNEQALVRAIVDRQRDLEFLHG